MDPKPQWPAFFGEPFLIPFPLHQRRDFTFHRWLKMSENVCLLQCMMVDSDGQPCLWTSDWTEPGLDGEDYAVVAFSVIQRKVLKKKKQKKNYVGIRSCNSFNLSSVLLFAEDLHSNHVTFFTMLLGGRWQDMCYWHHFTSEVLLPSGTRMRTHPSSLLSSVCSTVCPLVLSA